MQSNNFLQIQVTPLTLLEHNRGVTSGKLGALWAKEDLSEEGICLKTIQVTNQKVSLLF